MSNAITIQATRSTPCGHTETVFERECSSRAGARKCLLAAIEREVRAWGGQDDVSWMCALQEAARWDADTDFSENVRRWNAQPGGLRFVALVGR